MKRLVILAAGDFPVHPEPLKALAQADVVVLCDGAAGSALKHDVHIDYVVGDMDSLDAESEKLLAGKLIHIREQDTNDLQKAFRFTMSLAAPEDDITILGVTGKREDHTIANISLIADFAQLHHNIRILSDTGCIFAMTGPGSVSSFPGQAISIFNPGSGKMCLTSRNLQYPLEDLELSKWWTASLNRALGEEFSLSWNGTGTIVIFAAYQDTK